MHSPGLRQSLIVLAIVTIIVHATIGSPVDRATKFVVSTEYIGDLATQESVQIKNVINPNDTRQDKDDTDKVNHMEPTVSTSQDDAKTESDNPVTNIHGVDLITNKYSEVPSTVGIASDITTFDSTTTTDDTLTTTESTISSNESVANADISVSSGNIINSKDNLNSTAETSHVQKGNIPLTTIGLSTNGTEFLNVTDLLNVNDQTVIDRRSGYNLNDSSTLTDANLTLDIMNKVDLKIINTQTPPTTTLDAPVSTTEIMTNDTYKSEGLRISQESTEVSQKDLFLAEQKVKNALNYITTEPTREELATTDGESVLAPNKVSFSKEEETSMIEAETRQTTLPIPTLETLSEELISSSNQLSTISDPNLSMTTEAMPVSEFLGNTQQESATVVSKRGGFLDFSKKSFASDDESSLGEAEDSTSRLATRADAEAADVESRGITKFTAYESRTLAEDAMREEELLKFGVNDFSKHIESDLVSTNSQADPNTESGMTKSEHVTEDALSVQPISQDRRTTLYTVGPNYKPMKRLEVQPAKTFVRDPDDNSWRNESISSLGIVYKPKNSSSKSFKEVLKTKTEIELSNSRDKDRKGTELRERLEKITEVRKRKKKVDKFGDEIYADYEEGSSAERTGASPADTSRAPADTDGTSAAGADITATSPMTTTKSASYWINQLEKINKDDMYKDMGLDVPTTMKPKKAYNLAEYYDTTDDYDVDYMTMPNIDIKKYTVALTPSTALPTQAASSARPATPAASPPLATPAASPPLATPAASPAPATRHAPQFPDRQPTVQYFPPTTRPPKVSMNEYDVDFENRIKAYTQQTMRPVPRSRAPAPPSDRLRMRPTVRPSDFTASSPAPRHLIISSSGLERGSFVIRHLGEFLGRAAAREEEARAPDFPAFTAPPPPAHEAPPSPRDYDDEAPFRRDVVDRFVDSFNLESDRFNVAFPVLVNSSVVHGAGGAGEASSSTFMKRLLDGGGALGGRQRCAAAGACERLVELSPAYELHYYVPEQEERDAADGPDPEPDRPGPVAPYGAL